MGWSRLLWLSALLASAAAGCSLAFHPEDYYGPEGGGIDASSSDRSVPADASTRDGRRPNDASDVGPMQDGSEGDAGDVEAGPFCKGIDAAFCADFDEGSLILGWVASPSPLHSSSFGELALDESIAKSKPASMLASLPTRTPDSGGSGGEEFLEEDLSTGWREVTLDFDLYIGKIPSGGGVSVLSLEFLGDTSVGVEMGLGSSKVTDAGTLGGLGFSTITGSNPSDWLYGGDTYLPGAWVHVTFDVLPATTGGKVSVYFDEILVQAWMGISFESDTGASDLRLQLGLSQYGAYTPAIDVHYDNVVLRYP